MGVVVSDLGASRGRARSAAEYGRASADDTALVAIPGGFPLATDADQVYPRRRSERLCRAMNVVVSILALIAMAPVMLLIAVAIRLTSKGPVFYSQVRVGVDRRFRHNSTYDRRGYDYGGRPFTMFKFRTMRLDAEAGGQAVWAQKNDPRATPIGNFLRKTRLDELPQFWNVLRGDMNIVGPRPERPGIFAQLREDIPLYAQRQRVRPGITGWAQVNQAYDSCIDDVRSKVQFDLDYIARQSILHDLRIMSMTVPVMIRRQTGW
jgi:lipopolysaccharide/colanic/teichoic acid biosynthesis glycosyltransferase